MRLAKEERRTRRQSGVSRGKSEARKDVEHGPRMVDVDPWAVLLEQLLEGPTEAAVDQGGPEDRPTTAAQPEAGAAVRPKRPKKGKGAMDIASRRCMVLAEIGNGYTAECHLAEIELSATFTEVVDWVKARDSHLADDLRGKWTYVEVYIIPSGGSIDQKWHAMTLRHRHGALSRLP